MSPHDGELSVADVVALVQRRLSEAANPEKAEGMQRYMKTEMPFYGVQKPGRVKIMREIKRGFTPADHDQYLATVTALWNLPHREEKYLAQAVATTYRDFMTPESLPLSQRFIVEGAWWDFVDETATHMIRELVLDYPDETWPSVDPWNGHNDLWLRRTSIICQIGAKERTDTERLFRYCRERMHENEFFIRKAIGWALREYAKTDPDAVRTFTDRHKGDLSGLSYREATKHL